MGLDVGSTTASFMAAAARLVRNCVTGRNEFGPATVLFRPDPVFTPFRGESLDIERFTAQLDGWIAAARLNPHAVVSGGALVTGLAARSANAQVITQLVRDRFQQAVVAATDDPSLESWLAFMGNALGLSRAEPQRDAINLDIGGGTTNVAWGRAGEVRRCGCYYVGARHVQVEPGTYRVRSLSPFARELFSELGVPTAVGYELSPRELDDVMRFYVRLLEAVVSGGVADFGSAARRHCQVQIAIPANVLSPSSGSAPVLVLSGGVGELAYAYTHGKSLPGTTAFGDLGIDLARRIAESPVLGRYLKSHVPAGMGRATVQGLTIHSTEMSGGTLFLPFPEVLPLANLPVLGSFGQGTSDQELAALLQLAARSGAGACLRVFPVEMNAAAIAQLGKRLATLLERETFPSFRPLVLLATGNFGKTLGQYATRWGQTATALVVVDEVPDRPAHFATIGKPFHGLVPVTFHGFESRFGRE